VPISIGIPFYNAEAFLADAIRSIFAQTYQDWELILVDDGSKDRSLEIAHSVKDPRVRVISDGQNKRLPYRLNQITHEAKFDLVGRMDADDLISPNRFERQVAVINDHPEIDLVTTGICSISNDKRPVGMRIGVPKGPYTGRNLLLGRNSLCHAAILGRKSWFLRNPHDLPQQSGDFELWVRAFSKNDFKVIVMGEPLYYYREENNVIGWKLRAEYKNQREAYKKYGYLWFDRKELFIMNVKSYFKALIVHILSATGRLNILLDRRNDSIDDKNLLDHFNREIQLISNTKVPGLDIK
jgi:glycosyltransferase involved in cell wall biosynthesis